MLPNVSEIEEGNKHAFVSLRHVIDNDDKMLNKEGTNKQNKESWGTQCIFNWNKVEDYLNQNLCCLCRIENILVYFIEYCNGIDMKY